MEELRQLVPTNSSSHNDDVILCVKTSFFDCGGIAVGVCLSHKIADAASFVTFMNAWAATCRGGGFSPRFNLAVHFPPTASSAAAEERGWVTKEKITTKRFVFDAAKIEKQRRKEAAEAAASSSRAEAVLAFFWRSFIEAAPPSLQEKWSSAAFVAVNSRPALVPPLSDRSFGNCVMAVAAVVSSEEDVDEDGALLVSRLRAEVRAGDDDYIKGKKGGFSLGGLVEMRLYCPCSSWLRFGVYEVGFGWGKPAWVCPTTTNALVLIDAPCGGGVETWANIRDGDDVVSGVLQANYNKLMFTHSIGCSYMKEF